MNNFDDQKYTSYESFSNILIELDDKDLFETSNGKIIRIRTYGDRDKGIAFFNIEDIEWEFSDKNLIETILDDNSSYKYKEHYIVVKPYQSKKSMIHFTFNGLMHWIQTTQSKSDSIHQYREWVNNTIFVHQMGTDDQRKSLTKKLANKISLEYAIDVLGKTEKIAGIYLLSFGKLKDAEENLPKDTYESLTKENKNDHTVYKFGCTNDFRSRFNGYQKENITKNKTVFVEAFYPVEENNRFSIETSLREFSTAWNYKIKTDKLKDWFLMDKNKDKVRFIDFMKSESNKHSPTNENLQKSIDKYIGDINDLTAKHLKVVEDLKNKLKDEVYKLKDEVYKNELRNRDMEILVEKNKNEILIEKHKNEILVEKHKNELNVRDIELLQMKLKISEMKLSEK